VETKGMIGDSRGNIDAIPPIKNEMLDIISRQIFVRFFVLLHQVASVGNDPLMTIYFKQTKVH
jgi:hypothetical protein